MDAADRYRLTALMWAARGGHARAAEVLVTSGASVDAADDYGFTALMWVAQV